MKTMLILTAVALLLAALPWLIQRLKSGAEFLANTVTITALNITPKGRCTRLADASFTARYLLCKKGTDASHIDICTASDIPLGVVPDMTSTADQAASDLSYPLTVDLLGMCEDTQRGIASAAIAVDAMLVAAAAGQIKTLPATTGTYYIIGRALTAPAAAGDMLEFVPCFPIQRVVP